MNEFSLSLVRRHFPQLPQPLPHRPGPCCSNTPMRTADQPRGSASRRCSRRRWSRTWSPMRSWPKSLAQSHALWHLRSRSPGPERKGSERQTRHRAAHLGPICPSSNTPMPSTARPAGAPGWWTSATWATTALLLALQCPEGGDGPDFLARHGRPSTPSSTTVAARSGSFSAEHGIGALKTDELGSSSAGGRGADAVDQAGAGSCRHAQPGRVLR